MAPPDEIFVCPGRQNYARPVLSLIYFIVVLNAPFQKGLSSHAHLFKALVS